MKTKRTALTFILMAALAVTAFAPKAHAQQYDSESDFWAEREGKGITIISYIGSKQAVRIPPTIQGLPVTGIGDRAFFRYTSLTSITIPDSVTSIGNYAFYYCTSLTSVTIPDSVTSIGGYVFASCASLAEINVGSGNAAYSSDNGVLYNKAKTQLIQYPLGKTGSTFTIPASVTRIGSGPFARCKGLTAINVDSGNSAYSSQDGVMYNKDKTTLMQYPAGKTDRTFTIPDSVTNIADFAFRGCTALASVTIPNSVNSIGDYAFYDFAGLASITIPKSVTSLGEKAFENCASLASVTFQGMISTSNFSVFAPFPGDLRNKYLARGAGRYTRARGGERWTKR